MLALSAMLSGKKIQVNPYEIARLAGNLGISTTEFIVRYTVEKGAANKTSNQIKWEKPK